MEFDSPSGHGQGIHRLAEKEREHLMSELIRGSLLLHHNELIETSEVSIHSEDGTIEAFQEYYESPKKDFGDDFQAWAKYTQWLRDKVVKDFSGKKIGSVRIVSVEPDYIGGDDYESFTAHIKWEA